MPGKFHEQRSLASYSSWACKESDMSKHTGSHYFKHSLPIFAYPLFFVMYSLILTRFCFGFLLCCLHSNNRVVSENRFWNRFQYILLSTLIYLCLVLFRLFFFHFILGLFFYKWIHFPLYVFCLVFQYRCVFFQYKILQPYQKM